PGHPALPVPWGHVSFMIPPTSGSVFCLKKMGSACWLSLNEPSNCVPCIMDNMVKSDFSALPLASGRATLPSGQPAAVTARPLYKALDALLTAPLQPPRSTGEALRLALSPGQAKYERLAAAVQAVSGLWPGGTA